MKQLFAETLINLCAALNPDVADEVADAEYRTTKELALTSLPFDGRSVKGKYQRLCLASGVDSAADRADEASGLRWPSACSTMGSPPAAPQQDDE